MENTGKTEAFVPAIQNKTIVPYRLIVNINIYKRYIVYIKTLSNTPSNPNVTLLFGVVPHVKTESPANFDSGFDNHNFPSCNFGLLPVPLVEHFRGPIFQKMIFVPDFFLSDSNRQGMRTV
ncbi:hypothetical protein TNCV_1930481 [Trichonephila clavipes]|nr:hypothetical protein TNCV_1930481 [Trichonephila clavipes]